MYIDYLGTHAYKASELPLAVAPPLAWISTIPIMLGCDNPTLVPYIWEFTTYRDITGSEDAKNTAFEQEIRWLLSNCMFIDSRFNPSPQCDLTPMLERFWIMPHGPKHDTPDCLQKLTVDKALKRGLLWATDVEKEKDVSGREE